MTLFSQFRNPSSIKFLYECCLLQKPTAVLHEATGADLCDSLTLSSSFLDFTKLILIAHVCLRTEVYLSMAVMKSMSSSLLVQRAAVYIVRRLAYYPQGTRLTRTFRPCHSHHLS